MLLNYLTPTHKSLVNTYNHIHTYIPELPICTIVNQYKLNMYLEQVIIIIVFLLIST